MAASLTRAVSYFTRKAVSLAAKDLTKISTLNQSFSRPLSLLCQRAAFDQRLATASFTLSKYENLHTEGDRRFVELLNEELSEEKKHLDEVPGMSDGWKITLEGASGTLSKVHAGDRVEVSFTLNGSISPPLEEEEVDPDEDVLVSYPEFNVKVTKPGSSRALEFECYFPDDVQNDVADESLNIFSIRSVVIYEGEVSDKTYIIETENLDRKVYSYFMSYLADRSIDKQFAEEFIQLTTAAEQREYIQSLAMLKDFIASK